MSYSNSKLNCEGKITGGTAITIDTQNVWQHLTNVVAGDLCQGLTVELGVTKSITSTANSGGQLRITATAHGIADGDYVSIGVRNITNSANITINEAQFVIFKVS